MVARMVVLALFCLSLSVLSGCEQPKNEKGSGKPASVIGAKRSADSPADRPAAEKPAAEDKAEKAEKQEDVTELKITDLKEGTGATARPGRMVSVHYRGTLTNGTEFDSSHKHGAPFEFRLGAAQVIRGWDDGVEGMKVGGQRKLVIPPSLGYGATGAGGVIPPNATLVFEIELLDVK